MAVMDILLSISLYAAVIFCGIMAFQKRLKNKLSPSLQYGLWFLLIARLLLPVTIESGFHFITIPAAGQKALPMAGTVMDTNAAVAAVRPAAVTAGQVVLPVWLAGMAIVAACILFYAIRMNGMLRQSTVLPDSRMRCIFEECKKETGVRGNLPLRLCTRLSTPALTVSLRPRLLLPFAMATADEATLRYAILHELTHYRRADHLVRILMNVLKAVWWFHPVVWLADRRITMDMETACDSMVVRHMEKQEKKQYANTVVTMFSQEKTPRYILGMALGSSKQVAEQRIRGIYMKKNTKRSVKLAAGLLAVILLVACFTTACSPAEAADRNMQLQESVSATGGADGPQAVAIEKTDDTAATSADPQPAELPADTAADGVIIRTDVSDVSQKEDKAQYTFTIENNSGTTIEDCKLEASAIKEGQIGGTFSLENGQRKTIQWTTAKQVPIIVEAVLTFQKDGETKSCKAMLCVPEYIEKDIAIEQQEQPAPSVAVEPTPAVPSADEGPVPTPQPTLPSTPEVAVEPTPTPSSATR